MKTRRILQAALASLLLSTAAVQAGSGWVIDWWTIDAGGEMVTTGADWTLSGTLGQWDATTSARLTGQNWSLTGGFWAAALEVQPPSDALFSDRFEP